MSLKFELLENAHTELKKRWPEAKPHIGLILGSGWGNALEAFQVKDSIPYSSLPGLGTTGAPGHAGKLNWCELHGVESFVFQGRRHWYEGADWNPIAIPIYLLKQFAAKRVILSNAAGGINPDFKAGELMLISDHINFIGANPLVGTHSDVFGPRFPDMSYSYNREFAELIRRAAVSSEIKLHSGVYLAVSGPSFETPAEIKMFSNFGADAVGMSTVPEAILANAAGLEVAAFSCISNHAAGISAAQLTEEEVFEALNAALPQIRQLFSQVWQELI